MNILELLHINNEDQKGFANFKTYLKLNKAIHHFVHCMNKQLDDFDPLPNNSEFKLSKLITTLVFLKNCIEQQDIANVQSMQVFCEDVLAITNFTQLANLLNYVLKKEVNYIDEKLMNSIESTIIEGVKRTVVGAHYDSTNNEFTFDDIDCNVTDSQHLFDETNEIYTTYYQYNFDTIGPDTPAESEE